MGLMQLAGHCMPTPVTEILNSKSTHLLTHYTNMGYDETVLLPLHKDTVTLSDISVTVPDTVNPVHMWNKTQRFVAPDKKSWFYI